MLGISLDLLGQSWHLFYHFPRKTNHSAFSFTSGQRHVPEKSLDLFCKCVTVFNSHFLTRGEFYFKLRGCTSVKYPLGTNGSSKLNILPVGHSLESDLNNTV